MRKLIGLLFFIQMYSFTHAQAPNSISFQSVLRDPMGVLLANNPIGVEVNIYKDDLNGIVVYSEIHSVNTNSNGLFSLEIGKGQNSIGNFDSIDWSYNSYFIETGVDLLGGSNYTIVSSTKLMSVPYAFHSNTTDSLIGGIIEVDPSVPLGNIIGEMQIWDGSKWITLLPGNEGSVLTIVNGMPSWVANSMPVASDIILIGSFEVGEIISATYVYNDDENDLEGGSIYKWYRSDDALGLSKTEIEGATSTEYLLKAADENKYISFEVTPIAQTGTEVGLTQNSLFYGSVINIEPTEVYNPVTGKIWMDRNLGATKIAEYISDTDSYGDLYQWGRSDDGHQYKNSGTTIVIDSTNTPNHDDFILNITGTSPTDWRIPQNDNLWQGLIGTNNPCPEGYRLPTLDEWLEEMESWEYQSTLGAFGSPLKLPAGGMRLYSNGSISGAGNSGRYWTSTVSNGRSVRINILTSHAHTQDTQRAMGCSIRCIKG